MTVLNRPAAGRTNEGGALSFGEVTQYNHDGTATGSPSLATTDPGTPTPNPATSVTVIQTKGPLENLSQNPFQEWKVVANTPNALLGQPTQRLFGIGRTKPPIFLWAAAPEGHSYQSSDIGVNVAAFIGNNANISRLSAPCSATVTIRPSLSVGARADANGAYWQTGDIGSATYTELNFYQNYEDDAYGKSSVPAASWFAVEAAAFQGTTPNEDWILGGASIGGLQPFPAGHLRATVQAVDFLSTNALITLVKGISNPRLNSIFNHLKEGDVIRLRFASAANLPASLAGWDVPFEIYSVDRVGGAIKLLVDNGLYSNIAWPKVGGGFQYLSTANNSALGADPYPPFSAVNLAVLNIERLWFESRNAVQINGWGRIRINSMPIPPRNLFTAAGERRRSWMHTELFVPDYEYPDLCADTAAGDLTHGGLCCSNERSETFVTRIDRMSRTATAIQGSDVSARVLNGVDFLEVTTGTSNITLPTTTMPANSAGFEVTIVNTSGASRTVTNVNVTITSPVAAPGTITNNTAATFKLNVARSSWIRIR